MVAAETLIPLHRPVGEQLREWRLKRRMSQLSLATLAEISTRHLSFVETGRSAPSRDMILRLATHLDVPLRDRNDLLLAAGFAPAYAETALEAPQMSSVKHAIHQVLTGHDPFPALVVDRNWDLVDANHSLSLFTHGAAPELLAPPVNALRLALHPEGLAARIVNLAEWRAHLLNRLYRRINLVGDVGLGALYDELSAYPCDQRAAGIDVSSGQGIVVPMRLREEDQELALFCTMAVFGSPRDITVSELAIESFFPADARTSEFLLARHRRAWAARGGGHEATTPATGPWRASAGGQPGGASPAGASRPYPGPLSAVASRLATPGSGEYSR
jgi:transcriptional regulator with XRE-family HTH domain